MSEPDPTTMVWQHRGLGYPIRLYRKLVRKREVFAVRYGEQLKQDLTYEQACTELGASIMHAVRCMGQMGDDPNEGT